MTMVRARHQRHAGVPGPERAGPDLRPLQVLQHRHRLAEVSRGGADPADGPGVVGVAAVGEVEPGDVDAVAEQLLQRLRGGGGGSDGGDDLGAAHGDFYRRGAGWGPAPTPPAPQLWAGARGDTVPPRWNTPRWSAASRSCSASSRWPAP